VPRQAVINFGLIMENWPRLAVSDKLRSKLIMLPENKHSARIIMTQMVVETSQLEMEWHVSILAGENLNFVF
jgi:hypothetical protein